MALAGWLALAGPLAAQRTEQADPPFRSVSPPVLALKTNLLYGAALTPNLGIEIGLGRRLTLDLSGGYNPGWNDDSGANSLEHWLVRTEIRYWFGDRFDGHFVGAQGLYTDFNLHGYPWFDLLKKDVRSDGTAFGGGLSYGYHWALARHWGLEFSAAFGGVWTDFREEACPSCTDRDAPRFKKTYFGPTGAGVKVIFLIP